PEERPPPRDRSSWRIRAFKESRSSLVAMPIAASCLLTSCCTSSVIRSRVRWDQSNSSLAIRLTCSVGCPLTIWLARVRAREGLRDSNAASTYLRTSSSMPAPLPRPPATHREGYPQAYDGRPHAAPSA